MGDMSTRTRVRARPLRPGGLRAPWPFQPGAVVGARFAIQELLGRGGLALVYLAHDHELGRQVALKVLRAGPSLAEDQRERFLREARVGTRLRHPHVVPVHEAGIVAGWPFLALEPIDGPSLELVLLGERRLSARRTLALLAPVAAALGYAHREGVVHRDVKPQNVLLSAGGVPFLADFGLALDATDPRRITAPGCSVGTPAYVAPEQRRGQTADARSDVYAFGVTLFECLTGAVPRALEPSPPAAALARLAGDAPAPLRELCLACLESEPAARPGDGQALAEALRGLGPPA